MLSHAMLFYIGVAINAPAWYWAMWGVCVIAWLIGLCIKIGKLIYKIKEE